MYLSLLGKHIKQGTLHLHLPDGKTHSFGEGGTEAHWYVRSEKAMMKIARDWEFELGQTYMDGHWDTGEYSLRDLIEVLRANFKAAAGRHWYTPLRTLLKQGNRIARSYQNIAHHYDVKEEVFRYFLDTEMFYSCAYFRDPDNTLEQAQQDKAAHIAAKLLLEPGQHVLDIGCGWGSLALYLAENHDVQVTGITLSTEQLRVAQAEAAKRGLDNVHFELADYREHSAVYDRIVSVGMLEHVGIEYFNTYFQRCYEMLKPDGVALIHSIGNWQVAKNTNPWIDKYIFPGGRIPSLHEMSLAVEASGLLTTDVEALRLHYAYTLKNWYQRFQTHRSEIRQIMGGEQEGERFCRMWEFYLTACEATFRYGDLLVYQYQVARQHGSVPLTRDYLYRSDKAAN